MILGARRKRGRQTLCHVGLGKSASFRPEIYQREGQKDGTPNLHSEQPKP